MSYTSALAAIIKNSWGNKLSFVHTATQRAEFTRILWNSRHLLPSWKFTGFTKTIIYIQYGHWRLREITLNWTWEWWLVVNVTDLLFPTLKHGLMSMKFHVLCVNCSIRRYILSASSKEWKHLCRSNFSSSHWLNGLWKQGKWFSSDNRGCISLHHSSAFTIHPANGNNGIYHRRRHPQNNGNAGETVIDSNWILFRNPGQERKQVEPDATGSQLSNSIKYCH